MEPKENEKEIGLEKAGGIHPTGQPPATTDSGKVEEKPVEQGECCLKKKQQAILEAEDKRLDDLAEDGYSKFEQILADENGLDTQVYDPVSHQPVPQTPQNSIDWNELGNSYASTKKYDQRDRSV